MPKEMIISVNGREKKIAIVDNGKVTEFYIERGGEENSGVVGNIYKGRVQRVLPGMQSAFVEIGLERDAFLYVSDFFDEEEEIERIVMEKGKKAAPEDIKREADDKIERARLERERQMEDAQEIAEPLAESGMILDEEDDDIEETEESLTVGSIIDEDADEGSEAEGAESDAGATEEQRAEQKKQRKNRRERKREKRLAEMQSQQAPEGQSPATDAMQDLQADFAADDSSFERVVDDEDTGEMFKDAYRQEAIVDKVRAVEFDMESTATAEVGSLIAEVGEQPNGFERIADEDESASAIAPAPSAEQKKGRNRRGGRGKGKGSAAPEESAETATQITDMAESTPANAAPAVEPQSESKDKKRSSSRGRKGKGEPAPVVEVTAPEPAAAAIIEEAQAAVAEDKSQARGKSSRSKKSGGSKGKKGKSADALEDAEASVRETGDIAEMAVRRGGRGGRNRRGGRARNGGTGGTGKPQERYEGAEMDETVTAENEIAEADFVAPPKTGYQGGGRGGRDNRDNRDSRGGRDRSQPTITDLLREGQEILVQIAKEPIARKGARITSHIALPGRFLVYMPTIEHLGVSRKIESSSERARLRNLIQSIKRDEEVPSGGFIVRTAGIGISDEDLRQDARYLVRTWVDIKKQAEKSKSPALVHQDLDIIQRILRDQLSDDFTAIRVDSEEEYLRIVEFINRIQPRMVSRVKLFTRDEPILEAYGVQEEIDKALKPRVWLKSGGYLVINQTEALIAIDVNTGKFVGKGNARLEDTITKTNMEAVDEIARQIRLRDLGGIIVLDLIDMEDRRNRQKVLGALQDALASDKSPTKVLSFNDFGLIIMTRKRVKQSLERTMCAPCDYCEGAGWVKSPQTVCYEILAEARRLSRINDDVRQTTLRVHPDVALALRSSEKEVLEEIEAYLGATDVTSDKAIHQEQFDFAFI